MPRMTTTKVCSLPCAIIEGKAKTAKQLAKRKTIEKKQTREAWLALQPKSYWLQEAQKWFNKFIRMRDDNKACISCGRHHTGQYHAGHYRSVGSSPHLRFNEHNCHRQCSVCNNYLSGNQIKYRQALINKIGVSEVEALEADNTPKHYTTDDIQQLINHYKQKVKALQNESII